MALPVNGSTWHIWFQLTTHFIDPERMKGWVGLVGWPIADGFTHISGHLSAAGRAQDRESSPATDRRSTTVPRHQLWILWILILLRYCCCWWSAIYYSTGKVPSLWGWNNISFNRWCTVVSGTWKYDDPIEVGRNVTRGRSPSVTFQPRVVIISMSHERLCVICFVVWPTTSILNYK